MLIFEAHRANAEGKIPGVEITELEPGEETPALGALDRRRSIPLTLALLREQRLKRKAAAGVSSSLSAIALVAITGSLQWFAPGLIPDGLFLASTLGGLGLLLSGAFTISLAQGQLSSPVSLEIAELADSALRAEELTQRSERLKVLRALTRDRELTDG